MIPTIIILYSIKRYVFVMESLVFAARQKMEVYTLDTPDVYLRRLCHIDLNISGIKDRLKRKL
jgi:hypothetical protein